MNVNFNDDNVTVHCEGAGCKEVHNFTSTESDPKTPEGAVQTVGWSVLRIGLDKKALCPKCTDKRNEAMFGAMSHPNRSQR